jgi:flagellar protein FliS
MYATFAPAPARHPARRANPYQRAAAEIGVAGADAHRLIEMLFEAFAAAVAEARGALRRGDVAAKCAAIGHAVRLVDEGLRGGLDLRAGGRLASDLDELYSYVARRLTEANLHGDEAALDECQRLLRPLHESWLAIAPGPRAATAG